jgi:hypothetical protein
MSRVSPVFLSIMFFVAWSCGAARAEADTIRVTSGFVDAGFMPLGTPLDAESLVATGTGFNLESPLEDEEAFVQLASIPTFGQGALVDFSGTLFVQDVIAAHLNGAVMLVAAPFTMSFMASPAPLDCQETTTFGQCTSFAPFRFEAQLTLTPIDGGSPMLQRLIGNGTVRGTVFRNQFGEFGGVRYTFAETSATPEPATLSLFMTGAFMAGSGLLRRRRRL